MKIKFISYGYKFYEQEGLAPPEHDFLFNLRDLPNPYWEEKLRPHNGLEQPIIEFFADNEYVQDRLEKVQQLVRDFVIDFLRNENRKDEDKLTVAFRCTGGKHRSVYFAESVYKYIDNEFADKIEHGANAGKSLVFEVDHLEMHRYQAA